MYVPGALCSKVSILVITIAEMLGIWEDKMLTVYFNMAWTFNSSYSPDKWFWMEENKLKSVMDFSFFFTVPMQER